MQMTVYFLPQKLKLKIKFTNNGSWKKRIVEKTRVSTFVKAPETITVAYFNVNFSKRRWETNCSELQLL